MFDSIVLYFLKFGSKKIKEYTLINKPSLQQIYLL